MDLHFWNFTLFVLYLIKIRFIYMLFTVLIKVRAQGPSRSLSLQVSKILVVGGYKSQYANIIIVITIAMDLNTNSIRFSTTAFCNLIRLIVYAVIYSTQNPNSAPCNDRQRKKCRKKRASFPDDQFELSFFLCRCNRERCQRKAQKRATRGWVE